VSFEKRLEAENQALRNINQLTQRWEDRITAKRLRLGQRFQNLELHILLHLRVVESGKCWGVLLEKKIALEPIGKEDEIARKWSESAMFVDAAVKLVDSPEIKIPAFVWFEEIESFYNAWPDTIYKAIPAGFVTSNTLRNREGVSTGNSASSDHERVAHQVIEGGTEIVGDISHASRNIRRADKGLQEPVTGGESHGETDVDTIRRAFPFLVASLSDNDCSGLYTREVGCQIIEVLFGPLNLYANQDDSFVGRKQKELLSKL
jgi:hypothetical protein